MMVEKRRRKTSINVNIGLRIFGKNPKKECFILIQSLGKVRRLEIYSIYWIKCPASIISGIFSEGKS